jgi:hypothetical protein
MGRRRLLLFVSSRPAATCLSKKRGPLHQAATLVLATVSPSAADTEYSLSTLRHADLMADAAHAPEPPGESIPRVHWVAVPKAMRARRVNSSR